MRDGVQIPSDWTIIIRNKVVRVGNAVRKSRVEKVVVRKRGSESTLLVPRYVYEAIESFEKSNGYADLKLYEYLNMLFGAK